MEEKQKRKKGVGVALLQNKPGRKPKKAGGRKKKMGAPTGMRQATKEKMFEIMNAIAYGLAQSEHNKDYIPYTPMTMQQAAAEFGLSTRTFVANVSRHEELKERYEQVKQIKREVTKSIAENNLDKALEGMMDIEDKDVARLSLDYMKSTDKAFNPKLEIEQNVKRLNLDISDEELKIRIQELMNS